MLVAAWEIAAVASIEFVFIVIVLLSCFFRRSFNLLSVGFDFCRSRQGPVPTLLKSVCRRACNLQVIHFEYVTLSHAVSTWASLKAFRKEFRPTLNQETVIQHATYSYKDTYNRRGMSAKVFRQLFSRWHSSVVEGSPQQRGNHSRSSS